MSISTASKKKFPLFKKTALACSALLALSLSSCGIFVKRLPSGEVIHPTPGAVDHMVAVNGLKIHYAEYAGTGEIVVMVHGFGSSSYSWERIAPVIQAKGYHIYAPDMKGFGWSDKPKKAKYDAYTLMQDVNAWMETMGLKKVIYVGNSLGGAVGLLLTLEHPDKVDRLVLVDAGGYPMKKPAIIRMASIPFSSEMVGCLYGKWIVKWNLGEVYYDSDKIRKEQVQAYYDRVRTRGHIDTQVALSRAVDFDEFGKYLERVRAMEVKTLIIWGRDDQWIPLDKVGLRFQQDMKNSTLVVIPECGHIPQEEKPEITARYIIDFLDGKTLDEYNPVSVP